MKQVSMNSIKIKVTLLVAYLLGRDGYAGLAEEPSSQEYCRAMQAGYFALSHVHDSMIWKIRHALREQGFSTAMNAYMTAVQEDSDDPVSKYLAAGRVHAIHMLDTEQDCHGCTDDEFCNTYRAWARLAQDVWKRREREVCESEKFADLALRDMRQLAAAAGMAPVLAHPAPGTVM